jgi:uncharacterized protein with PQ loop repeat
MNRSRLSELAITVYIVKVVLDLQKNQSNALVMRMNTFLIFSIASWNLYGISLWDISIKVLLEDEIC